MTQRLFIPGSQWLYFKIYTGRKTADDMLAGTLYPYVKELHADNLIDGHFFIRYTDPGFHLRFRVHVPQGENYAEIFRRFYEYLQPQIDNGLVAKVMCDTYNREIERYGESTMTLLEELFRIDSTAIMELISRIHRLSGGDKDTLRWQISLVLLDDTLSSFGYELLDKVRIANTISDNFKKEFGFTNHAYTKQLNDKYRTFRSDIERGIALRTQFADYEDVLQLRREQIALIAEKIEVTQTEEQIMQLDSLLSSIQHMTMNRWFRSRNRQHELVVHDFMSKYYESAQARKQRAM